MGRCRTVRAYLPLLHVSVASLGRAGILAQDTYINPVSACRKHGGYAESATRAENGMYITGDLIPDHVATSGPAMRFPVLT